jgi:hypothetical protein
VPPGQVDERIARLREAAKKEQADKTAPRKAGETAEGATGTGDQPAKTGLNPEAPSWHPAVDYNEFDCTALEGDLQEWLNGPKTSGHATTTRRTGISPGRR